MGKRILYVKDLPVDTRARDLAREFERYGPIVRCDIPAPRRDARFAYAFVEYEDSRDASDAYHRLHGKAYRGGSIRIEWAKRGPETRRDRDRFDRRRDGARDRRSRSPRRSDNEDEDRKRDRSPEDRNVDWDKKTPSPRGRSRSPSNRSRSPVNRSRSRSASPAVRSSPSSPARYDEEQI